MTPIPTRTKALMISTFSVSVTTFGAICSLTKNSSIASPAAGALLEQHERLADEILRRDLLAPGQRMLRRGHEEQLLAHDRHAHQIGIVDRQRQQPEIGGAGAQLSNEPRRRARRQLHVDVRIVLSERLEKRREDVETHRHAADQPQAARDTLLAFDD